MTNKNRGGFGWEPPTFARPGAGIGSEHDQRQAFDAFLREQMIRGMAMPFGFDAGDASRAPPRNPLAVHDDPIDMVEINGVWMCKADALASLRQIEAR